MGPLFLKTSKPSALSDLADKELFELMKNHESNEENAKLAWEEFYLRYARYLWNCCLRQCKSVPDGNSVALDIFQSTMRKVYDKAGKFDSNGSLGVKAWLSKVAQNEFRDYYKKYHLHFTNDEPEKDVIDEVEVYEDSIDDSLAEKVETIQFSHLTQLLSKLNEKEYDVLITYMSYHQIDKPLAHLPDPEMDRLCKKYTIKSEAVRQIRLRAMKKLKKFSKELL
jgi:RNA polymerase sigma factor (sigma-70 family)